MDRRLKKCRKGTPQNKISRLFYSLTVLIGFSISFATFVSLQSHNYCCQSKHPDIQDNQQPRTPLSIFQEINSTVSQEIDCDALIRGDENEIKMAVMLSRKKAPIPDDYQSDHCLSQWSCICFKGRVVGTGTTSTEGNFPLAFSLMVFKDFYQVEKLFRAIYRSYHFYCIHVDAKSSAAFLKAVRKLVSCFPNVFFPDKLLEVHWGTFSVLDAELQCFHKLLSVSSSWRYVINLTGQEYPIRTLNELQRILEVMNGSNSVEKSLWTYDNHPFRGTDMDQLKFYKGAVHVTLSRGFVEYIFHHENSEVILTYLKNTKRNRNQFPDETFFSTLNSNPGILKVPGAYTGNYSTNPETHAFFTRYKRWEDSSLPPCRSDLGVHSICIIGIGDLQDLDKRPEFFANKFYYNWERLALECMEYRFWRNSAADYSKSIEKTNEISLGFYASFDLVKNHL